MTEKKVSLGSLKKEKKGRKQNPGLVSWVMLIKSAAMYSGTIKQNGDRQYRQQCHTHTKAQSSVPLSQTALPSMCSDWTQPAAHRAAPSQSFPLAPKCLRPLQETLECFFFSWLLGMLHGHQRQVRVSSQTLWAALTFRGVLRGCRQWQTCHQGPQLLNVVGLGA